MKRGGCSEWPAIGGKSVIIGIALYSAIETDMKPRTAIINGVVLQVEAAVRLAK